MDTAYSLSDIAAAMNGENGFGNNSAWLIILFVLIFGWGGTGFNKSGELNQYATAASQQQILFNQQFDQLGQKINQIGDGICSSTFSLNNSIANEGRNLQSQLCALNSNIDNKFAALEKSQLEQTIAAQQQQINALNLSQQLAGVVRYPLATTYTSGANPFCSGCGCGNYI